jgi:uncharacterized membrane protein YjgN (DUF898 family)
MAKENRKKYDEHKFIKAAAALAVITLLILIGFIIWYFVAGPGSDSNENGNDNQDRSNLEEKKQKLMLMPLRFTAQGDDLEIGVRPEQDSE